ncbi:MAG: hypothetical protein HY876_02020, partial [Coriobacteriales bacterium]|nr:hypothetical protein [Coriobacteriales bacterium]
DLDAVCAKLAAELWVPVIPVNAPGFVGPKNLGNRIAGETLLEHVIGTAEPPSTTPTDIALVGEYNVAGDLAAIEPLLAECGINVLSRLTGNASFEEIRWAHRARLTAVSCSRALVNVAAGLHRGWGMPWVEIGFFGSTETARSLRTIAEALEEASPEAAGVVASTEAAIARREAWLAEALEPYRSTLAGKRAVLYSGGVKSWAMAAALHDLGIEVVAVGVKKSSAEDEEKVREVLGAGVPLLEDVSAPVMRKLMADADLLVAGGRNRYVAAKEGWPFVVVNQEREHAYAGYEGLVTLARDLAASVRYYERERVIDVACPAPRAETPVRVDDRPGCIDPLKNAPSEGAIWALQGVHRALPVHHGAQGCSFLGKVLAIRHANEPIALGTTKLFTEDVVLGSEDAAVKAVRSIAQGTRPDVVALVSGALAEVKGDDTDAVVRALRAEIGDDVLGVHVPDYTGGFEDGYAVAVAALVELAEPCDHTDPWRVTVLAGAHLTPGDVDWLRETVESFGLQPVMLPDLGALDGSRRGVSAMAEGGITISEIRALGRSSHTIVIGASLEPIARRLSERFGTPFTSMEAAHGLAATDRLLATLTLLSGGAVPPRFERQRRVLVDAMRDAHLELSGSRVTLALEPDHALSLSALYDEIAADVVAVVPTSPPHARRIAASEVVVGDFASTPDDTALLVASSRAARTAGTIGASHVVAGFPVLDRYGAARIVTLGYQGATELIDTSANLLVERGHASDGARA